MDFLFHSQNVFWLSIHTIYGLLALNPSLGEIAAYDYFKLFILHACTLMILSAHDCTDGSGDSGQLTQKWPQESSSFGSLRPFWLMALHHSILLRLKAIECILYILGRPKSRGPVNNSVLTLLLSYIMGSEES